MKINVLHIIKSLGRGGAETLLQEALRYHDKEKYNFHYIYFLPWKNQMVSGIEKNGGTVVNVPAKRNIAILFQANKILRYIKVNDIKLVHCHLPWAGFLGRIIHRMSGIPVIYTEHNKQERYHKATRFLNKMSFNSQAQAIAVSNDVAGSIKKNIKPHVPVEIIQNGVDTNHFIRNSEAGKKIRHQYKISSDSPVIGTIAVFRTQKRLKEWIDIFSVIEKKNSSVRGIIVGDGPLNNEIKDHIKQKGLDSKIVMPGLQTDVLPWLSAMDIFMMSSEFEGLPLALLEAMSMECSVVATDAGGISEVIRNEEDGFLVPVNEFKKLDEPLSYLLKNPDQIIRMGSKARQRIENSFSLKAMVTHTENLYSTFVN